MNITRGCVHMESLKAPSRSQKGLPHSECFGQSSSFFFSISYSQKVIHIVVFVFVLMTPTEDKSISSWEYSITRTHARVCSGLDCRSTPAESQHEPHDVTDDVANHEPDGVTNRVADRVADDGPQCNAHHQPDAQSYCTSAPRRASGRRVLIRPSTTCAANRRSPLDYLLKIPAIECWLTQTWRWFSCYTIDCSNDSAPFLFCLWDLIILTFCF